VKPLYYSLDERKDLFRLRNESLSECKTFSTFPQDIIILKKNRFCWYYKNLCMKIIKRHQNLDLN
jgi:hypothetical protein